MAGENAQFRAAFETSEGYGGHDWFHTPFVSETLRMTPTAEPDGNLNSSGTEGKSEVLKLAGGGNFVVEPTAEWLLPFRAHQNGWYDQTLPAAGVHLYELRKFDAVADTPLAHYVDSMRFGVYRDEENDPSEYKGFGAKVSQMRIDVAANKFLTVTTDLLYLRDTKSRVHEQAVNAAFTGEMEVSGHRPSTDAAAYYKLKITTGGALGVAEGVWGEGAGAYSATPHLLGVLNDILDGTDVMVGTMEEPYQLRIVGGGVFTVDDEFRIYPTSPKPVAVITERPKLNANKLDLEISVGGAVKSIAVEQFSITHITPRELKFGVGRGGKMAQRNGKPNGAREGFEFGFNTQYLDDVFERAMRDGTPISAHVKFYGGLIAATGLYDFWEFTVPTLALTAAGATVTGPGELPENVVGRAYPAASGDPLFTEMNQTTVASLLPT